MKSCVGFDSDCLTKIGSSLEQEETEMNIFLFSLFLFVGHTHQCSGLTPGGAQRTLRSAAPGMERESAVCKGSSLLSILYL